MFVLQASKDHLYVSILWRCPSYSWVFSDSWLYCHRRCWNSVDRRSSQNLRVQLVSSVINKLLSDVGQNISFLILYGIQSTLANTRQNCSFVFKLASAVFDLGGTFLGRADWLYMCVSVFIQYFQFLVGVIIFMVTWQTSHQKACLLVYNRQWWMQVFIFLKPILTFILETIHL